MHRPVGVVVAVSGAIRAGFSSKEASALSVVAPDSPPTPERESEIARYAAALSGLQGVSPERERLVHDVCRLPSPFPVIGGGESAHLVGGKKAIADKLPTALTLIAGATFVFTSTGAISLVTPLLLFCIAFGLSMDYEVFLLARIKEEYDLGAHNDDAVAFGLERTGRILTAAALLLALVFAAFTTAEVTVVKVFGAGLALAVVVDAFLIRGTLVPAFMRLVGPANWWAPRAARRFHLRFGIWETEPLDVLEQARR